MLARQEGAETYQRLVYQTLDVVPDDPPVMLPPVNNQGADGYGESAGLGVREEQAMFRTLPWQTTGALAFPLPIAGGRRNDLGSWQRLAWIAGIAIGTAIGFGAFLTGLEALAQLARLNH
jgi:hypothetical protein